MCDDKLENLLQEIAEDEELIDYKILTKKPSINPDGYFGIITLKTISGTIGKLNQRKVINLFIKSATKNEILRERTMVNYMFNREIFMYDKILPTFQALEMKHDLLPVTFSPRMYKYCNEDKLETLILEDLNESGYKLHDSTLPMDEEHVDLIMKQFGRFHALSFALRWSDPEKFQEFASVLDSRLLKTMKDGGFIRKSLVGKCELVERLLRSHDVEREILDKFRCFKERLEDNFEEFVTSTDRYSVIVHGDGWITNMMFKYQVQDNSSKPTDVRFFDYQLARFNSPVMDLSYFFYVCSSKEVINNWKYYIQLYHDSLSSYLRKFGCNPDELFPFEVLENHWKKYAQYGLMFAVLIIYLMLTKKEEIIEIEKVVSKEDGIAKAFDYEIANIEEYYKRVECLVVHFVTNNLI